MGWPKLKDLYNGLNSRPIRTWGTFAEVQDFGCESMLVQQYPEWRINCFAPGYFAIELEPNSGHYLCSGDVYS